MKKQRALSIKDCIRRDLRRVLVFCMLSALLICAGVGLVDGRTGYLITGEVRTTWPSVEDNVIQGSLFGMEYAIPLPGEEGQSFIANGISSLIPPGVRLGTSGASAAEDAANSAAQWLIDAAQFVMSYYQAS